MSTPPTPSPSMDKFDMLKNEILEQRKCLKRVMEKLDRDEEMVEKLKMEKEKAQHRYESSVRELEKTALSVKAVLEPMKKVNNHLKITDPPLPAAFSINGENKKVGEYSGTKDASGGTHNSGVAKVDQPKKPRVIVAESGSNAGKDEVKEEKSKAGPNDDKIRDAITEILKEVDHNTATFTHILNFLLLLLLFSITFFCLVANAVVI